MSYAFPEFEDEWLEPLGLDHELLDKEQEQALWEAGDYEALAEHNMRLCWSVAFKLTDPKKDNVEEKRRDLFGVACGAMLYAIPRWNPEKGRLAPYVSTAARNACLKHLQANVNTQIIEAQLEEAAYRVLWGPSGAEYGPAIFLRQKVWRGELTEEQALEQLQQDRQVQNLARLMSQPIYLDEQVTLDSEGGETVGDYIAAYVPDPEEAEEQAEIDAQCLRELDEIFTLARLTEREIESLMRKHGLDYPMCETWGELGIEMGLTKRGAWGVYHRALGKAQTAAAELLGGEV